MVLKLGMSTTISANYLQLVWPVDEKSKLKQNNELIKFQYTIKEKINFEEIDFVEIQIKEGVFKNDIYQSEARYLLADPKKINSNKSETQ